jgi:hypothetical protein
MKRKIARMMTWKKHYWGVWLHGARWPVWWVWHKSDAVKIARQMLHATPGPSQLVVHTRDGRIQAECTYGKDPWRSRG